MSTDPRCPLVYMRSLAHLLTLMPSADSTAPPRLGVCVLLHSLAWFPSIRFACYSFGGFCQLLSRHKPRHSCSRPRRDPGGSSTLRCHLLSPGAATFPKNSSWCGVFYVVFPLRALALSQEAYGLMCLPCFGVRYLVRRPLLLRSQPPVSPALDSCSLRPGDIIRSRPRIHSLRTLLSPSLSWTPSPPLPCSRNTRHIPPPPL